MALLGRSMKVSKEDIFGLVKALQQYLQRDHDREMEAWEEKVDYVVSQLSRSNCRRPGKLSQVQVTDRGRS